MKGYVHLWYLPDFFLEWEMFQTKVVEKTETHILCSITFCRQSWHLWENVEKYGGDGQDIDDSITRRMRFACWVTKDTDTHSEYEILIAFPRQQWLRERASMLRCTHIAYLLFPVSSVLIYVFFPISLFLFRLILLTFRHRPSMFHG